jgi:hypothetical protein
MKKKKKKDKKKKEDSTILAREAISTIYMYNSPIAAPSKRQSFL